jgi:telomerase Cajal body protein 1
MTFTSSNHAILLDAVGSVSFHPLKSMLLSVSGSRHYLEGGDPGSSSSDSGSTDGENEGEEAQMVSTAVRLHAKHPRERPSPQVKDASVKLWNFDGAEQRPDSQQALETM